MTYEERLAELDIFIEGRGSSELELISILHRAQEIFGYIPEDIQKHIGEEIGVSPAKIYGVVTFYNYFTLEPRGKHKIVVCTGTACHINGSALLLEKLKKLLKIEENQVTEDGIFSLETARCLGACALSPVIKIDEKIYSRVKPEMLESILGNYRGEKEEEREEKISLQEDKKIENKKSSGEDRQYRIRIANSTCAISSGAQKVIEGFSSLQNWEKAEIIKVGCMGF
ncbi:MAG: NAD(P)H-dependent oxidoreductase subunit E, partial [Fusobacteriaceae bacterium]